MMRLERWRYTVPLAWRALLGRRRADQELDDELSYHLERSLDERLREGLTLEEARRRAAQDLGAVVRVREACRDASGTRWIDELLQDLRYGARLLRKSRSFALVSVLTLALGIGANSAMFSLIDRILLAPLPYPAPERLVRITGSYPRGAVAAMQRELKTLDVAAYAEGHDLILSGRGEPVRLAAALVSADVFSILGAAMEFGRSFDPGADQPGRDHQVILSHAVWAERFGGDPSVVGRVAQLGDSSREIVGVMPRDFTFPSISTDVWVPLRHDPRNVSEYWAGDFMPVIGRLRSGLTIAQARAEIPLFQRRVITMFPWPMPASWNADVSVVPLHQAVVADVRPRLLMLVGAVSLVLLIACANVANLLMARAATREREIALRTALGAGRARVVRQMLTESTLLALLGGCAGVLVGVAALELLRITLPAETPRLADAHLDWRVLGFTAAVAMGCGALFGLGPAFHSARAQLAPSIHGSRGIVDTVPLRLRNLLVIGEIAVAVVLVIAAGLLIRSFWSLSHVDAGFEPEHVVMARLAPAESFCADPARCLTFYRHVLTGVESAAGIQRAALVNTPPLGGRLAKRALNVEGFVPPPGRTDPLFWLDIVTPDYFRVMEIPLLAGRTFSNADLSGNPPVALVTAQTARRFWGDRSAVGEHVRFTGEQEWRTIVGVVGDVRAYDLQSVVPSFMEGTLYVPYSPKATLENGRIPTEMTLAARTTLDESAVKSLLRGSASMAMDGVAISEIKSMRAVMSEQAAPHASTTILFALFGGLALTLGMVGVYGVVSFLVSRRTAEVGVRLALGAQPRGILWMILKEGAMFSLSGIVIGVAGAAATARVLSRELYGVSALDPITYLVAGITVIAVTMVACAIPARRAMRVDPVIALRGE